MMGVSLCEANQGTRERVCCPSEQGPSVWLRTRARPDARSSGKPVAMIALRLSPVWTGESQKVVSPGSECGAEILTYHVVRVGSIPRLLNLLVIFPYTRADSFKGEKCEIITDRPRLRANSDRVLHG
jgi:hypothetical protein